MEDKKYAQILPAVWKAEKRELEVNHVDAEEEVVERKLWAAEKITIPAGSAKLVKVRTEGNWSGEGVVEEYQEANEVGGDEDNFRIRIRRKSCGNRKSEAEVCRISAHSS